MDYSSQWKAIADNSIRDVFKTYRPGIDWFLGCTFTRQSDGSQHRWNLPISRGHSALTENDRNIYIEIMSREIGNRMKDHNPGEYNLYVKWLERLK